MHILEANMRDIRYDLFKDISTRKKNLISKKQHYLMTTLSEKIGLTIKRGKRKKAVIVFDDESEKDTYVTDVYYYINGEKIYTKKYCDVSLTDDDLIWTLWPEVLSSIEPFEDVWPKYATETISEELNPEKYDELRQDRFEVLEDYNEMNAVAKKVQKLIGEENLELFGKVCEYYTP